MKKIKIMLLSLALFAVVGGALAFKAKFKVDYCTAPIPAGGAQDCPLVACPNFADNSTTDGGDLVCTTTYQVGCDVDCITTATIRPN